MTLRPSSARDRLVQLQHVTSALSAAATVEQVSGVVTQLIRESLGACSSALWIAAPDGGLVLAAQRGNPDSYMLHYRRIPPGALAPSMIAEGNWVESEAQLDPAIAERARAAGQLRGHAALPLLVGGRVIGLASFGYEKWHRFSDDEKAFIRTVASHCAQALDRASLLERERAARAEAETANRLKDEFLATLSHELRTPLNAISGWVHMLRSGKLPSRRRAHALEVIERNARAQEQLIADLLDMSRVISGRLRLRVGPVRLFDVVSMAVEAVRPVAAAKGVNLETALDEQASEIVGDSDRLQQVVWNLLTNAVKFTPTGGRVHVSLSREDANVVVRVKDTGQGIPAEFLPHVFDPFRQADTGFARKAGGLGLGLSIARTLVEMHGGTIEVRSEGAGCGAEFAARLPAAGMRVDARPRVDALRQPRAMAVAPRADALGGARVLVVEDEPDSRELLISLLERHGAKVTGAASATEAIEKFRQAPPALLVSDVGLPGEDGLSLLRRIRSLPDGEHIGAIALTAFARVEDRERALAAGFDMHVPKPIEPEALVNEAARLIERRAKIEGAPLGNRTFGDT